MRCDHDLVGLVLGHPKFSLQHHDDELARREVIVDQDNLVQAWPFGLGADFCFGLGDGVNHPAAPSFHQSGQGRHGGRYGVQDTISRAAGEPRLCDGFLASAATVAVVGHLRLGFAVAPAISCTLSDRLGQ
jgi:hypothetical protein